MVQTIATLIDETLMVMGAHLHVRMTDEEKGVSGFSWLVSFLLSV